MPELKEKIEKAVWSANTLFTKGLSNGSTGNISFRYNDSIYISESGSCFGRLTESCFAIVDLDGSIISGKPSKELPLHVVLYRVNADVQCVIHTHSLYTTLFSCESNLQSKINSLFLYTPYLEILTEGKIAIVEYAEPGSEQLFKTFLQRVCKNTNVYILKNHGIVVAAKDAYKAFDFIEEFEISAKLRNKSFVYGEKEMTKIERKVK